MPASHPIRTFGEHRSNIRLRVRTSHAASSAVRQEPTSRSRRINRRFGVNSGLPVVSALATTGRLGVFSGAMRPIRAREAPLPLRRTSGRRRVTAADRQYCGHRPLHDDEVQACFRENMPTPSPACHTEIGRAREGREEGLAEPAVRRRPSRAGRGQRHADGNPQPIRREVDRYLGPGLGGRTLLRRRWPKP